MELELEILDRHRRDGPGAHRLSTRIGQLLLGAQRGDQKSKLQLHSSGSSVTGVGAGTCAA